MQENRTIYDNAYSHELLNRLIDNLTYNLFLKEKTHSDNTIAIDPEEIRKCVWLSSILANSNNENHRKKAQLFTALTYLQSPENIDLERVCYLLFSRAGNLTATRLFQQMSDDAVNQLDEQSLIYDFDAVLNLELALEREDKTVYVGKDSFITTKFQKQLWQGLNNNEGISISAPTSAGKSFIIKKYIKSQFIKKESFTALYIVPSRALINQVSEEFRNDVDVKIIDIKTAYLDDENVKAKQRQIYILTPERCLRLLQKGWQQKIKLDLIFIDEIQNIEESQGRGSLFEYVLRELHNLFLGAKIIIAGPNIINGAGLFENIFGSVATPIETTVSPVFQLKTIVRPLKDNKLEITLKSLFEREQKFELQTDFDFRKRYNQSIGVWLPDLINLFGRNGQNIIYAPRTDYSGTWAVKYAEAVSSELEETDYILKELIEFLKEEIHEKYYLIKCLNKRVAFHHGKLPDIVRKEIEDGFLSGRIVNLFCTATLIEGVNLPANNLFITSPLKKSERLADFEFGNLIGRAGRLGDSLYGTVYCIERGNDKWAESYYESSFQKEVVSSSEKSLKEYNYFINELLQPTLEIENLRDRNTVILLRQKFISSKYELIKYLVNKKLDFNKIDNILDILSSILKSIKLSPDIIRLNPSIDPILQDLLFAQINLLGLEKWVIIPNTNFRKPISKEEKESYQYEQLNFYWQLVDIIERLDLIFNIRKEAWDKYQISISIRQMCFYGVEWLEDLSLKELIQKDIDFYATKIENLNRRIDPNNEEAIDKRINEIIKINSTIVTFILVKYLKLLNDIIEPLMSNEQKERFKFSLSLPTSLELGTSEPVIKQLISGGISISVSIKIFDVFKHVPNHSELNVFEWLAEQERLDIKPIYNRYLKRLKLLRAN